MLAGGYVLALRRHRSFGQRSHRMDSRAVRRVGGGASGFEAAPER